MKKLFSLFLVSGLASIVHSGPISEEYKQIERDRRIEKNSQVTKKGQLQKTLLSSLKLAMLKFFDYSDYNKIKTTDFSYEAVEGDKLTYYVKYKAYLGYFVYNSDPSRYFLTPVKVKFTSKPGVEIIRRSTIIEEGSDKPKSVSKAKATPQPENSSARTNKKKDTRTDPQTKNPSEK